VSVESVFLSADSKYHREYLFISSKNTITAKRPLWHMAGWSDGQEEELVGSGDEGMEIFPNSLVYGEPGRDSMHPGYPVIL